jgi:hypothetical protein
LVSTLLLDAARLIDELLKPVLVDLVEGKQKRPSGKILKASG